MPTTIASNMTRLTIFCALAFISPHTVRREPDGLLNNTN